MEASAPLQGAHRQSFAACSDSLPAMMSFIDRCRCELAIGADAGLRLQLVAEELFTNTFRHGRCDATQTVSLEILREGGKVEFTYEDPAAGWNPFANLDRSRHERPLEQRPVGGLGIALIDGLAERVAYERIQERNRVRIWLKA